MESQMISQKFQVKGMTCSVCELKIEKQLQKVAGVAEVKALSAEGCVTVSYDPALVTAAELERVIVKLGYEVDLLVGFKAPSVTPQTSIRQLLGIGILLAAGYWLVQSTMGFTFIPQIDRSVGYGMLLVMGLLTSFHCMAMCGGISLAHSVNYAKAPRQAKWDQLKPALFYNAGRVISYTLIGGIVGALGSVISISGAAKGVVSIAGGALMAIIGLKMLDLFPALRKFKLSLPKFFGNPVDNNANRGPFYVGLLNGLMPCGPLQTMQLYAMSTGSFGAGAFSMFLFSLGTVPFMFGFGALSCFLNAKLTHRMLKVSAVLVIVLGLLMVNRGLSLSGITLAAPVLTKTATAGNVAKVEGKVQVVTTSFTNGQYQPFVVQKDIPVKWIIKVTADELNGCNNPVTIPKYRISKKLVPGENIIYFTPKQEGTVTYTCWMGMISSSFKVVSDVTRFSSSDLHPIPDVGKGGVSAGGGCCGR